MAGILPGMSPLRSCLSAPGWRVRDDCARQGTASQAADSGIARLVVCSAWPARQVDDDPAGAFKLRAVDNCRSLLHVEAHADCAGAQVSCLHAAKPADAIFRRLQEFTHPSALLPWLLHPLQQARSWPED